MRTTWFLSLEDLDAYQRGFVALPIDGRHFLEGPPGSGKTNLLLLRARYTASAGETNILIITYTNALADFIRSGLNPAANIEPDQIQTYHSWACQHISRNLGIDRVSSIMNEGFNDETRENIVPLLEEANIALPSRKVYSAIFVDEAQDFTVTELNALLCLSDRVCICGDLNQGIYRKDGLSVVKAMGLEPHKLHAHYRIGYRVAQVADRLISPENASESLQASSNYDPRLGESSAEIDECADRDEQFQKMLENILLQKDAFAGDSIGVICGKKATCKELRERFDSTTLKDFVWVHGVDEGANFSDEKFIHVLTMYSSKGTEYRAVHLYGVEEFHGNNLQRSRVLYTAVTRAKTALNAYRSGRTAKALENAFSEPRPPSLNDLF